MEGESPVKTLRAGLQGARGGQKIRAGEAGMQTDVLRPACWIPPLLCQEGGGSQEATALSRSPRELERVEGRQAGRRYLKALGFLRGAVSRKATLGPFVQHRGPDALVR